MVGYHETQSGFKLVSVAEDDLKLLTLLLLTRAGVTGMRRHTRYVVLEIQLKSSCRLGKYFSN